MPNNRMIYKEPQSDLRKKYPRWLEISTAIALFLTILLFFSFQRFENDVKLEKPVLADIEIIEVPRTKLLQRPPAPPRPKIPVPADEDADIPDDLPVDDRIFEGTVDYNDVPPPPEDDPDPVVPFYQLSEPPKVVNRVNPVYPKLAKKAGIEGRVVVKMLVDTKGNIEAVEVIDSHPLLDAAAIEAAWQFKFTPGKQRDRFVKVWMSVPFHFKLK